MGTGRQYDEKFKVQAVKLAKETGSISAPQETSPHDRKPLAEH